MLSCFLYSRDIPKLGFETLTKGNRKKYFFLAIITLTALVILVRLGLSYSNLSFFQLPPSQVLASKIVGPALLLGSGCFLAGNFIYERKFIPYKKIQAKKLNDHLNDNEYYLGYSAKSDKSFYIKSSGKAVACVPFSLIEYTQQNLADYRHISQTTLLKRKN